MELREFPDPTPGPGEVVLEMKASGMCGSDLRAYRAPKDMAAFRELYKGSPAITMRDRGPRIMGHEPRGEVVAVGEAYRAVADVLARSVLSVSEFGHKGNEKWGSNGSKARRH